MWTEQSLCPLQANQIKITPQNLSEEMNFSRIGQFCCRELNSSAPSRLSPSSLTLLASNPSSKRNSSLSNPNKRNCSSSSSTLKSRHPPRTFSGIQPTGVLHLGNYLGAVKGWVKGLEVEKMRNENWKDTRIQKLNLGGRRKEGFTNLLRGGHARYHAASKPPGAQVCPLPVTWWLNTILNLPYTWSWW